MGWILLVMAGVGPGKAGGLALLLGGIGAALVAFLQGPEGSPLPSEPTETLATEAPEPLRQLATGIIPVWSRQTETARWQCEEAISGLTSQFSGIQGELRQAAGQSGMAGALAVRERLTEGQDTLRGLVQALREAKEARNEILVRIEGMAQTVESLKEMSTEVAAIANQTNLLALNAAIEAAHARAHGKGFAIVAEEVRKLSERSGAMGQRITEQVSGVNDILVGSLDFARTFAERDETFIREAELKIEGVVQGFQTSLDELSGIAARMESANARVQGGISEALVHFQFQDRVSQILRTVIQDMERLVLHLETQPGDVEAEAWLRELKGTYITREQFAIHTGAQTQGPDESEITFF